MFQQEEGIRKIEEKTCAEKGLRTSRMESMLIGVLAAVSDLMPRLPTCTIQEKLCDLIDIVRLFLCAIDDA